MAIVIGDEFGNNLFGTDEDDQLFGLGGFDLLFASLGNDTLDGGTDSDVALYDGGLFTSGVTINNTDTAIGAVLAHTVDKRGFGTDTLIDVSNFHGTNTDDTIYVGGSGGTYTFDIAGNDLVVASQDPDASDDHFFVAGSGNDTLVGTVNRDAVDYSQDEPFGAGSITQGVNVDLAAGTATDGWGDTDTLTSIERVIGTNFNDTLRGNDDRNDFNGLDGADLIDGRGHDRDRARYRDDPNGVTVDLAAGTATDGWGNTDTLIDIERAEGSEFNDTLRGDDQRNNLEGEGGDDLLEGRGGRDNFAGHAGNDTIDGGADVDSVYYDESPTGVDVDLAAGTANDGFGTVDTLISIEEIDGSEFADTLRGSDGENFIDGRAGDDLLEGRGGEFDTFRGSQGNDTIDGGDGDDRVEYHRDAERGGGAAVTVNLETGTATDGFGNTDTLISIENVRGTEFGDTLIGNGDDNYIEGEAGDDSLVGNDGRDTFEGNAGNDTIDGGASLQDFNGGDRARYDRDEQDGGFQGIDADLNTGLVIDPFGDTDTLISIEEIEATNFDDTIIGSAEDERFYGNDGNDLLIGNDGNDFLSGRDGDDTLDGGIGGDSFEPGLGTDVIIGAEDGVLFEDDHLLYGYTAGEDGATSGITVTFTSEGDGTVLDYGGSTDTFSGIEIVEGTHNADNFIGAEGNQEFRGLAGNDTFTGGDGDDDYINYRWGGNEEEQTGVTVNMVTGTATDRYGDTDTFTGIERVQGSQFDDVLIGNSDKNRLEGRNGDDLIDSFGGVDNSLEGGRGNDTIEARGDQDFAGGGDGNDLITFYGEGGNANPGLGSDTITGGTEGFFSIGYWGVGDDVTIDVDLGTTTFSGSSDVDTFTNIVNIEGGDGNDTLLGNDGVRQEFFTSLGDDFIDGRGDENDGLDGDRDWLIYNWGHNDEFADADRAMVVNFEDGTATGVLAGNDTFVNIEAVRGSRADDHFIGSDQAYEEFQAMAGSDTIEGGGGIDRISYSFEDNRGGTMGITLDLAAPVNADGFIEVTDTFGDIDYISGIEQVFGSAFDDVLSGDDQDNNLIGVEGNDTLNGRDGDDFFWGGEGTDSMTGGAGADEFGGFLNFLDGDTITDFSIEDSISIFDGDFNDIAADATIVGNELRLDVDGDGEADATMFLENGYTGPVNVTGGPLGGPEAARFEVADAGLFTAVVNEGAVTADVVITRSGDILSTATVDVTLTGIGANPVDADDVTVPFNTPIRLTFVPGQEQIIYQIGISDDLDIEAAEDLAFTLSNPTSDGAGGAEIGGAETFVRILNNDQPETVNISGEKSFEDSGILTFTVSRTGDTSDAITVDYDVRSAGGLQGAEADDLVDGLPQSGSVVIPAGAAEVTFDLAIAPDVVSELHDDVIATISDGGDWPSGLSVGIAQATGSIRNDDGVPPVLPAGATGSNYGDPHIVTLDGLAYDFQAVGEFTLIQANSGDPLNVQVRFQPVEGSEVASQTTAVATELGSARIMIDAEGANLVQVNGAAFDLDTAIGGTTLGDGEIYYDGEAITLVYANGEQLRVDLFDGFLSTSMSVAAGRDLSGLLGNADGDASNDLALPDGTVLPQPVDFATLYGAYADGWRIDDATSLFDYAAGEGTADFTDLSFPAAGLTLADFPAEVVAAAMEAAMGIEDEALRDAAVLDYLLSGNTDFIDAALAVDESEADPVTETEPTDAPLIDAGIGIAVSAAMVTEGDAGSQSVAFTIYRTGDTSNALSVSYATGGTADAGDVSGATTGTLDFAAGETSKEVTFDINGDTTPENDETLSLSFAVVSGDSPVLLSSVATTRIVNDDLPPVAADDAFTTDEDTPASGNLFADNGAGADAGDGDLSVTSITLEDGTILSVGAVNDLGDGSTLLVDANGDMVFDPGLAYQALDSGDMAEFTFSYTMASGAFSDTAEVTIDITGEDDGGGTPLNPITGTEGSDFLRGTDGDDLITGLGGRFDILFGRAGADVFAFGAEASDGNRDRDLIRDYEAGIDSILLTDGATISSIRESGSKITLFLDGGRDVIYVRGEDLSADDLTITYDDIV